MERRSFLKGLIGVAVSLSPAGTILKKIVVQPETDIIKDIAPVISATAKKLKPFIITISNHTCNDIYNVDILGAYNYIHYDGFLKDGSLTLKSVDIASNNDASYKELLYQTMCSPFVVGQMFVFCENIKQLVTPTIISTYEANGVKVEYPMLPFIDPYGQQSKVLRYEGPYVVDGYTFITLEKILPKTELKIFLYPKTDVNPARYWSGMPEPVKSIET